MNEIPFTGDGYVDLPELIRQAPPFLWVCGGRGIGKTFGAFDDVRYLNPRKFLLMRRTQQQMDLVKKQMFNPFHPNDQFHEDLTAIKSEGKMALFYRGEMEGNQIKPVGSVLGYGAALSTIHNVRGVDLSDVVTWIYDEFVPERHERPIKCEWEAFLNAAETIGRNRELQGKPPLQFVGLTNSNSLGNPYFIGMGIMRQVDKMIRERRPIWEDKNRGIMVVILPDKTSPISEAKKNTSLYRMAGWDSAFGRMSLGNEFVDDHCTNQGSRPLRELRPLAFVGEIAFYEHKHTREIFCNDHRSGTAASYQPSDYDLTRARRDLWYLVEAYLSREIYFLDVFCEVMFKKYFKIST